MKKLVLIFLISISSGHMIKTDQSMQEWRNIAQATIHLANDPDMQHHIEKTIEIMQETLVMGVRKITQTVSSAERARLVKIVDLLHSLFTKYEDALITGNINHLDLKTKNEIARHEQELMVLCMPLLFFMQTDQAFVKSQDKILQSFRITMFEKLKKIIHELHHELH